MLWPAVLEGAAMLWFGAPFLLHHARCQRALAGAEEVRVRDPSKGMCSSTTVLLPTWNEAAVIERRLNNLAAQRINGTTLADAGLRLLLIDSASTDATVDLARAWLAEHPDAFAGHEVVCMDEREGKSAAVERALTHLKDTGQTEVVVMVDADATCDDGALSVVLGGLTDEDVGAVGGTPRRHGATPREVEHRQRFSDLRRAEGAMGATPFLEGSLLAFRLGALSEQALDTRSNADDAQITLDIAAQGWRTIQHPHAVFADVAPATVRGRAKQRTRRARGLLRVLRRYRRLRSPQHLARTLRFQRHAHLRAPWLALGVAVSAAARWTMHLIEGSLPWASPVEAGLVVLEALGFLGLVAGLLERRLPGPLAGLSTVLAGMLPLLKAWCLDLVGRPAHLWEPNTDARR